MRKALRMLALLFVCSMIVIAGCKKDDDGGNNNNGGGTNANVPTVITDEVTDITSTTAICGGEVTDDNGYAVITRGVCWSTTPNPTFSSSHTLDGEGMGNFTSTLTGLESETTYYVRAYAVNEKGTGYGEEKSFTTTSGGGTNAKVPTVITDEVTNITSTTAICGGEVTDDNGYAVITRGVCWSTTPNPTFSSSHTLDGEGMGNFTSTLTGLESETTYYVRAYAVNEKGTGYGEEKSFTTTSGGGTTTITVNGVTFNMIEVEGGTFYMGAQSTDPNGQNYDSDAWDDESPVHKVTLSSYYIGETEVTQELWQAVTGSNPSYNSGTNLPVEKVSWNDIQDFITQLNALTGRTFRLPTEAEWEFAARGGNKSNGYKYSGSNTIGNVAWYWDNAGEKTHQVGTKSPNELGIYDMTGNVWEWCQDWYGDYSSGSQTNPAGASSGSCRVRRGGSWGLSARYCRVSHRYRNTPDYGIRSLGFRLAASPQ